MSYTPIKTRSGKSVKRFTSITPVGGKNGRTFSALMVPAQALSIINYLPDAEGKMFSRKGLTKLFEIAGTNGVDFFIRFTSDTFIYAYGTTVGHYNETTGVTTTIKSDFSANDGFVGVRYGEYFFVVNGVEKMWMIDNTFAISEVAASPVMTTISPIGNRMAGVLASDTTQIIYSAADDGTNPPFDDWTIGTDPADAGQVGYRNAGQVYQVLFLGNIVIALAEFGKWGFTIDITELGGTPQKLDQTIFSNQDLGGFSGLITEKGLFYVNEAAIMLLVSVGQDNIPYSKQEFNQSYVLGADQFDDISFLGASLAYDDKNERLFISCRSSGSSVNNRVIVYNTQTKAYSEFTNWNISFFYTDFDGIMYGCSSVKNVVYKCLDGYTDDGLAIGTEYYQELTGIGDYNTAKDLLKFMVQADIPQGLELRFSFDIWNYYNVFQENVKSFYMGLTNPPEQADGYGEISYGGGGYGGNPSFSGADQGDYDTSTLFIRNFQRIFVRVTASGQQGHTMNMFMADIYEKRPIRIRNIVQCN